MKTTKYGYPINKLSQYMWQLSLADNVVPCTTIFIFTICIFRFVKHHTLLHKTNIYIYTSGAISCYQCSFIVLCLKITPFFIHVKYLLHETNICLLWHYKKSCHRLLPMPFPGCYTPTHQIFLELLLTWDKYIFMIALHGWQSSAVASAFSWLLGFAVHWQPSEKSTYSSGYPLIHCMHSRNVILCQGPGYL